jgi:hypothetical protein
MNYKPMYEMTQAERHQERIRRRVNTCVHHNGYFHKVCNAGVEYKTVGETIDLGSDGRPFVAACMKDYEWAGHKLDCRFTCDKAQFLTPEQAEADIAKLDAAVAEHIEKIAGNICPTHNIAIKKKQVGKCVYAEPCGCRLYQGTLPEEPPR